MAATQQPDFAVLANGLQMVQQEVALVPNMPQIVGINAIHQQMNAFLQQMNQNQQQNQQQMAAHQQQMATLQQQMNQNQQQNQEQMATLQQQMNQNQQQSRQQMAALQQQMNQMQQQMNQNHQQVVAAVGRVEADQALLPMRLFNAETSPTAHLRYPGGIVFQEPLPLTRRDLDRLTVNECVASAGILGLSPLPGNPRVNDCRRQIADYLGVPY